MSRQGECSRLNVTRGQDSIHMAEGFRQSQMRQEELRVSILLNGSGIAQDKFRQTEQLLKSACYPSNGV